MPQNTYLEIVTADAERLPQSSRPVVADASVLRSHAAELARSLVWLPNTRSSRFLVERCKALSVALKPLLAALQAPLSETPVSDDFRWLYDNVRLLYTELPNVSEMLKTAKKIPHVCDSKGAVVPRIAALAEGLLAATSYAFTEQAFTLYVEGFQESTVLKMEELCALVPTLKLVLLREIGETSWKEVLEPLILFDRVLRQDPADAYLHMDFDSRDLYRKKVVNIA